MLLLKHISVPLLIIAAGLVCMEISVPIALGEFFAGIVGGNFIKPQDVPWLHFFSDLGVLSIMFLAGFEMDPGLIKRHFKTSTAVGMASFFTPFFLVAGITLIYGASLNTSIIIGISLSTTSLAIVYSVLKDAGSFDDDQRQILLGAAMVADTLGVLLFSVLFIDFDRTFWRMAVPIFIFILIADKIVLAVFKRYKGNKFEFELKFLLLVLLALGFMAEEAGIHAAVLAFVLGAVLSGISTEHEEINSKLSTIVFSLLAPIFFFYSGTLLRVDVFSLKTIWFFSAVLILAMAGKYLGSYLGLVRFCKCPDSLARYGGIIFNYRLSFGIVTAVAAYERKIINSEMLGVALLGIAISAVITVILERRMRKKELLSV